MSAFTGSTLPQIPAHLFFRESEPHRASHYIPVSGLKQPKEPGALLGSRYLAREREGEGGRITRSPSTLAKGAPWGGLRGLLWQPAPPELSTALHRTWCSRMGFWKEL